VAAGAFVSNSCVCALFIFFYLSLLPCVRAVEREEKGEHRERVFPVETYKVSTIFLKAGVTRCRRRRCHCRRLTPILGEQIHHPPRLPHTPSSLPCTPSSANPAPKQLRRCGAPVEVAPYVVSRWTDPRGEKPNPPAGAILHAQEGDGAPLAGYLPTLGHVADDVPECALRRNVGEDDNKMTVRPLPPFLPPFFLPSAPPSSLISQIDLRPDLGFGSWK
jgi:hypothetical protein